MKFRSRLLLFASIAAIAWWVWHREPGGPSHDGNSGASENAMSVPSGGNANETADRSAPVAIFRCEGKTRCSQMTSCDEAKFYLKNCPGVKIDGDHDGIPCEDQLCGH